MATSLFQPIELRDVSAKNRVMVSPMCQYCAEDGIPTAWHHVHLGTRAVGGAGIVMTEATAVEPRGRITPNCIGIWSDEQKRELSSTATFIDKQGSIPAIQLAHAGRKASHQPPQNDRDPIAVDNGGWETLSPSGDPYPESEPAATRKMDKSDIETVIEAFRQSARRADEAGFKLFEIHAAHGYLLHQFYSPVTNKRKDEYGGSFENRTRLLRETVSAVRSEIPDTKPLFVRLSATDWLPDRQSWTVEDSARLGEQLSQLGVDLVDVSAGGLHPEQQIPETGPGYQVPYSELIRAEANCLTATVGKITSPKHADAIVRNNRADIVALGRELLRNPYWTLQAAHELNEEVDWPVQYIRAKP